MLKKRLIGVITVKNDIAVQSFGYSKYLPLGRPEIIAENLDRWGADEILLQCIDRTSKDEGPDYKTVEKIVRLGLGTPLIYAGGIRNEIDGINLIKLGAERICIDALLSRSPNSIYNLSLKLGAQALIASIPMYFNDEGLKHYNYINKEGSVFSPKILKLMEDRAISEALIIDCYGEGNRSSFNPKLIESFPFKEIPLIAFGGLSDSDQLSYLLNNSQVVAVAIGNFLNYRENAIFQYKQSLNKLLIRMPEFLNA